VLRSAGDPSEVQTGKILELQTGKILKEVGKQTIDQPGHFLIGAAPIWVSRYLVGVPRYGWVATPLLAYREWLQWPSKRWWDPPLDWAFLSLGVIVATCRRRLTPRLLGGLPPLRRHIARGAALRRRGRDTMPDLHAPNTHTRRSSLATLAQDSSNNRILAMRSR
jgi:hypothetical protein